MYRREPHHRGGSSGAYDTNPGRGHLHGGPSAQSSLEGRSAAMARQLLEEADLESREAPPEEQGTLANLQSQYTKVDYAFALMGGSGAFNHGLRRNIMDRWQKLKADIARIEHGSREPGQTPPPARREDARRFPLHTRPPIPLPTMSVNGYQPEGRAGFRAPPGTRRGYSRPIQSPRGSEALTRRADPEDYDDEKSDHQPRRSRHGHHGPQPGYGRHDRRDD